MSTANSGESATPATGGKESLKSIPRAGLIGKYKISPNDCGSPEVQVALLTQRIELLSGHFAKHKKDSHSQRGMLKLIARRKGLLQYLKNTNVDRYRKTISSLGLRK